MIALKFLVENGWVNQCHPTYKKVKLKTKGCIFSYFHEMFKESCLSLSLVGYKSSTELMFIVIVYIYVPTLNKYYLLYSLDG